MFCLLQHPSLKVISLKFLEVGHTYQEADSVHACINTAAKRENIYSPDDWIRVVKNAKQTGSPYYVQEMSREHFRDYKKYRDEVGLNEQMTFPDGSKLAWRDLRVIQLRKESPRSIFVRVDYDNNSQEIAVQRDFSRVETKPKYHFPPAISRAKWQDLQGLCNTHVISAAYKDFYENLPHTESESCDFADECKCERNRIAACHATYINDVNSPKVCKCSPVGIDEDEHDNTKLAFNIFKFLSFFNPVK